MVHARRGPARLAAFAILSLLASCTPGGGGGGASDDPTSLIDDPGHQGDPTRPTGKIDAQDEKWRQIAEEAYKRHSLQDQEKIAQSQEWYRQAVAYKDKADFHKAQELAQKSLQLWSENVEARKLLNEVNELIIGGSERYGQESIADKAKQEWQRKLEQAQLEITNHVRNGERYYNARQYDDAIRELEAASFAIKHIPYEVKDMKELETRLDPLLRRVKDAKIVEADSVSRLKKAEAEAEAGAHEAARRREVIEKIAHLLELSYMSFDQRKFDQTIMMCNEILMIDPHYTIAAELKEDATKARHKEEYFQATRMRIEAWKQLTAADDESVIPYSDTVRFPSAEEWGEISKRITQSTLKTQEGAGTDQDPDVLAIQRKLDTLRVPAAFESAKPQEVLDYLAEYSGLTIHVDSKARETAGENFEKAVPFKVRDLPLKKALSLLLSPMALDFSIVEGRIILITTPSEAAGKPVLELHDIRDILVRITDFPGPDVELKPPAAGGAGGGPGTGASFSVDTPKESTVSQEQIVELIKGNISPGLWEGEYSIVLTPNQQLLVNHTRKTHREIREFLQRLRSYTGAMVGVTARFVTSDDDSLDDVGVDVINRPSAAGYDVPGTNMTSIDDPSGELGPGFVTSESLRNERYDIRAQTFHSSLFSNPNVVGQFIDPLSNRLVNQGGLGLQYQWVGEMALQAVLRALHKSEKSTIVQAPRVTVFNTQRSHIMSINSFAYIADLEPQVTTYAAGYDPTIQVLNEGIVLDVRPIISNDRKYVTLELRPSFAQLQTIRNINISTGTTPPPGVIGTVIQLPWLVLQRAETTVEVPDRGTLMISGFKNLQMHDVHSGVPFLENIPILNFFFSRNGQSNEKRRMMILVTPEIIDLAEHEGKNF